MYLKAAYEQHVLDFREFTHQISQKANHLENFKDVLEKIIASSSPLKTSFSPSLEGLQKKLMKHQEILKEVFEELKILQLALQQLIEKHQTGKKEFKITYAMAVKAVEKADAACCILLKDLGVIRQSAELTSQQSFWEAVKLLSDVPFQIREVKRLALQREIYVEVPLSDLKPFFAGEMLKGRENLKFTWDKTNFKISLVDFEIFKELNNLKHTEKKGWCDLDLTMEKVQDFLDFAEQWQIKSLKDHCEDFLCGNLDMQPHWIEMSKNHGFPILELFFTQKVRFLEVMEILEKIEILGKLVPFDVFKERKKCRECKELNLEHFPALEDEDLAIIVKLFPNLRSLKIGRENVLTDQAGIYIAELHETLEELELGGPYLTDSVILHLGKLQKLKCFFLSGNENFTNQITKDISAFAGTLIALSLNDFETLTNECLEEIGKLTKLESLFIENNKNFSDVLGEILLKLSGTLTYLDLRKCEGLSNQIMLSIEKLSKLKTLILVENLWLTDQIGTIFSKLVNLEELYLWYCENITQELLKFVVKLPKLFKLEIANQELGHFNDETGEIIASLLLFWKNFTYHLMERH